MIREFLENLTDAQISLAKARVHLGRLNWIQRTKIRFAEKIIKNLININASEETLRKLVWFTSRGEVTLLRKYDATRYKTF